MRPKEHRRFRCYGDFSENWGPSGTLQTFVDYERIYRCGGCFEKLPWVG